MNDGEQLCWLLRYFEYFTICLCSCCLTYFKQIGYLDLPIPDTSYLKNEVFLHFEISFVNWDYLFSVSVLKLPDYFLERFYLFCIYSGKQKKALSWSLWQKRMTNILVIKSTCVYFQLLHVLWTSFKWKTWCGFGYLVEE